MPRKQITNARMDGAIDLAARLFAIAHSSLQAGGISQGLITTGLASQAALSKISHEDFDEVVRRAQRYVVEFEGAAREAGVVK